MMRRCTAGLLGLLLFGILFSFPALAAESDAVFGETLPQEYTDFLDALPNELKELLPKSLFSINAEDVGAAAGEMSDLSYLLQAVLEIFGLRIGKFARLFATLAGLLLLSSAVKALQTAFRADTVGRAFSFLSTMVILIALLGEGYESIRAIGDYIQDLRAVTTASIPLLGALYAMGGNVTAAVASSSGLSLFLVILEDVVAASILPFCGICLALALSGSLDPGLRVGTLSGTLKKNYTTVLTFLMMLLLGMLGAQTTLGARQDTLAMKSVKFAAGSMIPVVGGSISELLRTVSAGVGYLRGGVGICGILLLLLLLLPTLIELLLARLCWQLAASLADLLGCDAEKRLLEEFASLGGYLIAAAVICASVPILSFTLFLHCASAIG